MTFSVGEIVTEDGIDWRIDAVYGPNLYARTQVGGAAPVVPGGAPIITSGDEIIGFVVKGIGTNTPPAHLANERYVIGTAPTGAWAGQANMIAVSDGAAWAFVEPWPLMHAAIDGSTNIWTYNNATWVQGNTTVNNTITQTLPDGNYGGFTMAAGVATLNITPGPTTTPAPATTAITGAFGFDWFDLAGLAITGPNQAVVVPDLIHLPRLPSRRGQLSVDIDVSNRVNANLLQLQFSFDGGNTWSRTADNQHAGINGENIVLAIGAHDMPFDLLGYNEDDEYLWLEVTPKPRADGLRYRVQQAGFFDLETAGPVALRLVSDSNYPAGVTTKLIGVHIK